MSSLSSVALAPRDPILGLTEAFVADTNPLKVNLGVGVYLDADGKLPLLECVREAEARLGEAPKARPYLPIDGLPAYDSVVKDLVFGADSDAVASGRVVTVQGMGGTGALKIGADFLRQVNPDVPVLISHPSWENHLALFTRAGFRVEEYRYLPDGGHGIDLEGMLADLRAAAPGSVVVLHACCHNPTGYDLTPEQWDAVIEVLADAQLVPFLDMAYQGFSQGIVEDGAAVAKMMASGLDFFVSNSFSKSFSLYGERVGALSIVCADAEEAKRVTSQVKIVVRTNYSNPPTHGASVVATVLSDADLRAQWETELAGMRERIKTMRHALVQGLADAGIEADMSHITTQIGMFSYSGLSKDQMVRLREEFGVYGLDSGRLCVAALNEKNIGHVCSSIAAVL
ncbi:MAG TPA: amino acid aminotransferase [Propionibacteriaceae bacterium]|nr:amino acid aminotransferase [Propionibacteriaceae bacterium]